MSEYTSKKLEYLLATKTAIKNALVAKGLTVASTDTFRSYADKIAAIEGGGGSGPIVVASGTFDARTTNTEYTVKHNLGVVPDMIIVYNYSQNPISSEVVTTAVGVSAEMLSKSAMKSFFCSCIGTEMSGAVANSTTLDFHKQYGFVHSATTEEFRVGSPTVTSGSSTYGGECKHPTAGNIGFMKYKWFAIGGLV